MSVAVRSRQVLTVIKQLSVNKLFTRTYTPCYKLNKNVYHNLTGLCFMSFPQPNLEIIRYKHEKKKQKQRQDVSESEDDEGEEKDSWEDEITDKQTKIMTVKVNSLRADVILKAGLGTARNKIETMFYESKIRVNGRKLLKKSATLNIGDEIDVVKGASITNPEFLTVARVEILSASERAEGLNVKLRRNKSLIIENYEAENAWK